MPTPHNNAVKGDFAKTVLMPGDPLRAKFIAETFLTDPKLVNNVRGVQGYTGTYKGVPVSVMASGMGMPSIGIYSYELYTQYDVENIIRVGSAGAMRADLELGSVVAGQGACTNSSFADQYELGGSFAPICDFDLLMAAVDAARELGVKMPVGNLYSSDTFYDAAGATCAMPRWASWRWRWRPLPCTAPPPTPASGRWPSAPSPTILSPAKNCPPTSDRPPSPT